MWTQAAKNRLAELEPELMAEFGMRPIAVERRGPNARPSAAVEWDDVERWLLKRGVVARIDGIVDHRLSFDRLALVSEAN